MTIPSPVELRELASRLSAASGRGSFMEPLAAGAALNNAVQPTAELERAYFDAQDDLLETQPISDAGLLALINHLLEVQADDCLRDGWETAALKTVAAFIKARRAV